MGKRQKFNIKKVAKLIVKARKEHTMCEIAESMWVDRKTLYLLQKNEPAISVTTLQKIIKYFDLSVEDVFAC